MISQIGQFCEHCGTPVAANTKFCEGCGKPVVSAAPPVAPVYAPIQTVLEQQPAAAAVQPPAPALDNYTRLKKLYNQAAQVDPTQRDAFLVSMCDGDASMLQELRSMFVTEPGGYTGRPNPNISPSNAATGTQTGASQAYMIGVYRMLRELGRGGMGVVYLAVRDDGAFRKNVALKLLLSDCVNAEFISRFKQERQVLAALDHPNIARILDGGDTTDGMPYYVMEYVEGLPLDRYCDQQRLSLSGRIKIFQQVCLAVDYLHQNSILHRDLKPSNILVSSEGVVKLLDFGIAKVVGAGSYANPDLTSAQGRPMTPTYASPEQLSGATLHKTSDLYSLGAILYGLLTGRPAYNDLDDKLAKIEARETPTKPSTNIREDLRSAETTAQFRRAMMGELDSIVLMTMQIDAKDRYQSAADLAQDLQRFLDGAPVTAYHTSAAVRGVKMIRRKGAIAAGVLAAVLVVGGIGAWEWQRVEQQRAIETANDARLGKLIDRLEARLNQSVPPVDDVRQLREAFEKETPSANAHDALLAKGIQYLDHARAIAPANPNLNVQVGDAYQQLGTLQKGGAALATYQKAATSLVSAAAPGSDSEQIKQQLATVNARIRALGGATVPLTQAPPVLAQEAPPPPMAAPDVPAVKTVPLPKVVQNHPVTALYPPTQAPATSTAPAAAPAVSAATEEQLDAVSAKVDITDQTIAPVRQNLERDGQTLNADTLTRIARMHSSLDRAKRAVASGNEAEAKENLAAAEALADKLLRSVGR